MKRSGSRIDTITYVPIELSRLSSRFHCDLSRYSRSLSTIWDDMVRADAFWYVYQEPIRFVVSDYDLWKDFDHDLYHD